MQLLHQGQLSPADIANLPTTAEKAALDAATAPDGTNPYMTRGPAGDLPQAVVDALAATAIGSGETFATVAATGATLTPNQVAAITGATSPNASNPYMTRGAAGDLTTGQIASIVGTTTLNGTNLLVTVGASGTLTTNQLGAVSGNGDISPANLVAGQRQLLRMATGTPSAGSSTTWDTGLGSVTPAGYTALMLICPATGDQPVLTTGSMSTLGIVTFTETFTGNDNCLAWLYAGTQGAFT